MALPSVTQDSFQAEVVNKKGVVFVDFYADWCGPCKFTTPIIEELSNDPEYKNITFVKVDVDQNQELSTQYNIFSIPTFIIFKNGKPVNQMTGARDKAGFIAEIKRAVSTS